MTFDIGCYFLTEGYGNDYGKGAEGCPGGDGGLEDCVAVVVLP